MRSLLPAVVATLCLLAPLAAHAQFVAQYETAVNTTAGISMISNGPPLVFGSQGAILTWTNTAAAKGTEYGATFLQPADPSRQTHVYGFVTSPPVATGPLVGTVSAKTVVAVLDRTGVELYLMRNLSVDVPMTYDSDLGIALIANSPPDQLVGYNFSNSFQTNLYTILLSQYPSAVFHQPLYYRAFFYVLRDTTIAKFSSVTGAFADEWLMPCNITTNGKILTVTFGSDANGPLDAFIAYGYSSVAAPAPTFQICRFSHNNGGKVDWSVTLSGSTVIDDVVGVNGLIVMSGIVGSTEIFSKYINATSGEVIYTFQRSGRDVRSYPVSVPMPTPTTCKVALMVQQWQGRIIAYCAEDPLTWLWSNNSTKCYHSAVLVDAAHILCNDFDTSIALLKIADGTVVVQDTTIRPAFGATVTRENGNTLLWITTTHAVIRGYSIGALVSGSPPSGGLGAGYVVLIIVIVLGVAGGGGWLVLKRRAARSTQYEAVN